MRVQIYSYDHAVKGLGPHAHVKGGGPDTRIGQNGKPGPNDPELTPKQQEVVKRNLPKIRSHMREYMRWWKATETKSCEKR